VQSSMLHGSETWPVGKENEVALQRAEMRMVRCRDVKRLSVYRLSFIFLVLVFEFQKSIIVSNLGLSS